MLFNSWAFVFFLAVVLVVFYHLPTTKNRQLWLLLSSLYFYGSWRWEYLGLLVLSSLFDWVCGINIENTEVPWKRKLHLCITIFLNLSLLGYFKYYNFFISNFSYKLPYADVALPVGISFYTFQTMGYSFDVYNRTIAAERSFFRFLLFICFFPQLVAGPIEKYCDLMPQFEGLKRWRDVDYAGAIKLMTLGFFKKSAIADRIAPYIDNFYVSPERSTPGQAFLAVMFFAIQLYCDFAGYTDIARGVGKLLGFELQPNFYRPYQATDIKDLLRRWHISLIDWFKTYVYFPLGGNKRGKWITWRNYLIVMSLSGLWHGAGWTFILWGVLIALSFIVIVSTPELPIPREAKQVLSFVYFALTLILYRAKSLEQSWVVLSKMLEPWSFGWVPLVQTLSLFTLNYLGWQEGLITLALICFWVYIERLDERKSLSERALLATALCTVFLGRFDGKAFIYFHF